MAKGAQVAWRFEDSFIEFILMKDTVYMRSGESGVTDTQLTKREAVETPGEKGV
jgi:hypothetical protein